MLILISSEKSTKVTSLHSIDLTAVASEGAAVNAIAMDIVKRSPKWKPGMNDGKGVRVTYQIPLVFTAQQ